VAIALLTTYLAGYRMPIYRLLAERHGIEVLCYGRGDRYIPAWFADLDRQLTEAPFPARRINGPREAFAAARRYEATIAPYAGGAILPAAYAGTRMAGRPFVLWASVWAQPRSLAHTAALPVTRHIYRHAAAVVAYGEHVKRFVAGIRGTDADVFVAPQAVEPELFGRLVSDAEVDAWRRSHGLPDGPLVLYAGRLVPEKGVAVLLEAWRRVGTSATLVFVGDGPLAAECSAAPRARLLGPLPRPELPIAYRAAVCSTLPSIPTPRFREPWGLVCNESMHQARPVVATEAVGAVAGGLVRDGETGLVVAPGDAGGLAGALEQLLRDEPLRARLGTAAREAVAGYTPEAMLEAFDRALAVAISPSPTGPRNTR
jgi:glycosyltransferase involved in cell wall biosynthesis